MGETTNRKPRRIVVGVVSSDKMHKTIAVEVERFVMHPQFKKFVRHTSRYKAHDEMGEAKIGDLVELMECRPLSKTKFFRLTRVLRRGPGRAAPALDLGVGQ